MAKGISCQLVEIIQIFWHLFAFTAVAFLISIALTLHISTAFFCDGIPGGLKLRFPITSICDEYIACHHDMEHEWKCPRGRFFSQRQQKCVDACDPTEALNACAGLINGLLLRPPLSEFPFNCRRHYECLSGMMIGRECPVGTFFSQRNQGCGSVQEDFCIPD